MTSRLLYITKTPNAIGGKIHKKQGTSNQQLWKCFQGLKRIDFRLTFFRYISKINLMWNSLTFAARYVDSLTVQRIKLHFFGIICKRNFAIVFAIEATRVYTWAERNYWYMYNRSGRDDTRWFTYGGVCSESILFGCNGVNVQQANFWRKNRCESQRIYGGHFIILQN